MKNRADVQRRYVQSIVEGMSVEQLLEYAHYTMMHEMDAMTDEELVEEIQFTGETQLLEGAK